MATTLYMRDDFSDYSFGAFVAKLDGSNSGWQSATLSTVAGNGVNSFATSTVAGTTNGVEVALSGTPWQWISLPLAADVTISGSITWNLWASESSMNANVAINGVLEVIDGKNGTITLIDKTARTTELGTSSTVQNFSETPASGVACKKGDRLRVTIFGDDAGTMASGFTFTFYYDHNVAAASGDSYLTLTETVTFDSNASNTILYLTDVASDVATSAVDRKAWTSRGDGVSSDVTNTAGGWLTPIQFTDTAGGTVVDWWTPQLTAFTLGGVVWCNIRAATSNVASNASIRVEIAVCNSDGTGRTLWGSNTFATKLTVSEVAQGFWVSGDDVSVSDGQRLNIRVLIDDNGQTSMVNGHTVNLYYDSTTANSSGDTWLQFASTLTEYVAGTQYNQSVSGTLSFSGAFVKMDKKANAGTLSFVGSQAKRTNHTMTGALSFIGSTLKKTSRAFTGGLSFIGGLVPSKLSFVNLTGALSFSGSLGRRTGKSLAGTLTTSGAITRAVKHNLTGTLSFVGSTAKRTSRSLAGGLSFVGSTAKRPGKALSGGLTFSGSLGKRTNKALSGGLSFVGSVSRFTSRALSGALSFIGNLATQLNHAGGTTYEQALSATLSFSGAINKQTSRSLAGGLSFVGSIAKRTNKALSARLSFGLPAYPPNTTPSHPGGYLTDARPGYLEEITDSTWGTKIKRITNTNLWRNQYSVHQSWNLDGTRIMFPGYGARILDGNTYADLGAMSVWSDYPVWSNLHADYAYGVKFGDNRLRRYSVSSNTWSDYHTFSGYTELDLGGYSGNISDNDRIALIYNNAGSYGLVVYDIENDQVISSMGVTGGSPSGCEISRSGNYVVVSHSADGPGTYQGTKLYNASDMSLLRHVTDERPHMDMGKNALLEDVFVYLITGGDVRAHRCSDGNDISILAPSVIEIGHPTCTNYDRPGWVYGSSNNITLPTVDCFQQIVAIKMDGSETVEVFCFHHGTADPDFFYDHTPLASASRDGRRVIWGAPWGASLGEDPTVANQTYSYVAYGAGSDAPLSKKTFRGLTAALSFVGGVVKRAGKVLSGVLPFSGSLASVLNGGGTLYQQALSGTLNFSGNVNRKVYRSMTATLTTSGTLSKRIFRSLSGSLSFVGSIAKSPRKALAGALSFVGNLTKRTSHALAGALSFTGNLTKRTSRALAGALSFVGNFVGRTIYTKAFTAALSFVGSISKQTNKRLLWSWLDTAGSLSRRTAHGESATLNFVGDVAKFTTRAFSGALSFVGNLTPSRLFYKALTATLSFVGNLSVATQVFQIAGDVLNRTKTYVTRFPWYARGNRRGRR